MCGGPRYKYIVHQLTVGVHVLTGFVDWDGAV